MSEIITTRSALAESREVTPDLYQRFVKYIDASPKTVETYTRALRQLFSYLQQNGITRPTREDILSYRDSLKENHKPTTVQNYITAARLFFSWLEGEGMYPNVAAHIKGAKLDREHKKDYLTTRQVKRVLEDVDRTSLQGLRDYAILTLMITGGLRTIEVVRANVEDLRTLGDETVLYIQGKGREEKTEYIKVQPQVEAAIREYLKARGKTQPQEPLFGSLNHSSQGERMSTRSISRIAKEAMQEAGYDSERLTAHSLRHTAVTLSLMAGQSLEEVQQFARHANISTTMIYNHALDKAKNGCSEAIARAIF